MIDDTSELLQCFLPFIVRCKKFFQKCNRFVMIFPATFYAAGFSRNCISKGNGCVDDKDAGGVPIFVFPGNVGPL